MDAERKAYIEGFLMTIEDLPDGAYFARLEEEGIDPVEVVELEAEKELGEG